MRMAAYLGGDSCEREAYNVCEYSLRRVEPRM